MATALMCYKKIKTKNGLYLARKSALILLFTHTNTW